MNGGAKVVCVTGASGYVASWIVKLLLLIRGYKVKATVRDPNDQKKTNHLLELDGAKERLKLFKADLLEEGSFEHAIDGCDTVFHTASPVTPTVTDPQIELIEPAVKGTINVLKTFTKVSSVKRVVLTSSTAAVLAHDSPLGPNDLVDETLFSDPSSSMVPTLENISRRCSMEVCQGQRDGIGCNESRTCDWTNVAANS